MADKPLYHGNSSSTPTYYGSSKGAGGKAMYGGESPVYYGAGSHYGSYGQYGGPAGNQDNGADGSVIGTITLSRILRVVSQRWLSVFVFVLVGLIVAFAVYRISPRIYEASSDFSMDTRKSASSHSSSPLDSAMPDFGANYAEIFNTRLPEWRSDKIVTKILQAYRKEHPTSINSDETIQSTLSGSNLELKRNSRLITITVSSTDPQLAAALADAYADAIEEFTDEENRVRCDRAVSQIHEKVEKKRGEVDKLDRQLQDVRAANKVDTLKSTHKTIEQGLTDATSRRLALETEIEQLEQWEKLLIAVQSDPERYGLLSSGTPRAQEIATDYRTFQDAISEKEKLLVTGLTEQHPDVITKQAEIESAKSRFLAATARALETERSDLQVARNKLSKFCVKEEELRAELMSYEQRIVLAESELTNLEAELGIARRVMEGLILDENKARLDAEFNNEIIRVARRATVPKKPVSPNPLIVFGVGISASLILGLIFVLVLDNLEDTIVNLGDIEGRLALKVLAVLPHVRLRHREQVAKFAAEDKYSQFSETVAGLRNLLDSPRYEAMSHVLLVISTQPGEGKTITSTSIAISYSQAGKKTLHVDFDLRRPRLAKIWDLTLKEETSFSHTLQKSSEKAPDFASLIQKSGMPNLDVIASLPPDGVAPSSIFGSAVVAEFFEWARANYDRIVIDAPPFGVVGDTVSLSVLADGILIMCRPDRTHFKPIQFCSRTLTEAGANILGVIVNDVELSDVSSFSPTHHHSYGYRYGYGYGRGYGYGYGYRPAKSKSNASTEPMAEDKDKEDEPKEAKDSKEAPKDENKSAETLAETPAGKPSEETSASKHSKRDHDFSDGE
ncbi:MAG: AAA family ATPase [Kiritimatiellae bacterium]|nr:AAA family ATPase [Kiritimatiellia bacterium]